LKLKDNGTDNGVQPGTKPPTRDNRGRNFAGIEENGVSRTGDLKTFRQCPGLQATIDLFGPGIHDNALAVIEKMERINGRDRALYRGFSQIFDCKPMVHELFPPATVRLPDTGLNHISDFIVRNFYSIPRAELEQRCLGAGMPGVHATTVFRTAYKALSDDPWTAPNLPAGIRLAAGADVESTLPVPSKILVSRYDRSVKFLFRLEDGALVESVLMPEKRRVTLCVSSQVGCRQACTFCHTGRMGLMRNLDAGEIVGQVVAANRWIASNPEWLADLNLPKFQRITNVVFMGMGEPLDNVDAVAGAITIMTDPLGLGLALRRISVSTAGHLDGLSRMLAIHPDVRLAISIHSPFEAERSKIMPINKKWPLGDVINALREAPTQNEHGVLVQYTLIHGVNDSLRHAEELVRITCGLSVKVNLIPLNEIDPSRFRGPAANAVESFRDHLHQAGIRVMVRYSKGQDIAAACGQLVTESALAAAQ
jgi:23S rRNA (adenine2503-C2)-methyltransferase